MEKNRDSSNHLFLKGWKPAEIIQDLNNILGVFALSNATIYNWTAEFKCRRISTNEQRLSRPKIMTNLEMIEKIHDIMLLKDHSDESAWEC